MTNINRRASRDEVLFAFHEAHARPTVDQIIEWTERYPQFADDIRAHAAVSRDWAARGGAPQEQPNEAMLANAYSRALSALYDAELETSAASGEVSSQSLHEILAACGKTIPSLEREIGGTIGIARSIVADLFNGAMLGPISGRLSGSVRRCLSLNAARFDAALSRTLAAPRLGHANSNVTPTVNARSCEQIIRDSDMSPEQISYWLGED